MKLTLTIEDATLHDLRDLLGAQARVTTGPANEELDAAVASLAKASAELDAAVAENDVDETPPAAEPAVDETADPLAALLAETDAKFKRSQTVTLGDGTTAKPEDTVVTEDGEVGVIEAVWRGRAAVVFEDGSHKLIESKGLSADQAQEPEPEQEPEPANDTITEADLREAAKKVVATKGSKATVEIMKQHGGVKVSDIDPRNYGACLRALTEAAA